MLYNGVPVEYISALNWLFNSIVWSQLTLNDTVNDVGYVQLHYLCIYYGIYGTYKHICNGDVLKNGTSSQLYMNVTMHFILSLSDITCAQ